jgi:hypothetical protein
MPRHHFVVWLTFRAHPRRLRRASEAAGVGCSALLAGAGPLSTGV